MFVLPYDWLEGRNVRIADKGTTVSQTLAAQMSIQFSVARRNNFWLVGQCSKLEKILLVYWWRINSTISQLFLKTINDRQNICAT